MIQRIGSGSTDIALFSRSRMTPAAASLARSQLTEYSDLPEALGGGLLPDSGGPAKREWRQQSHAGVVHHPVDTAGKFGQERIAAEHVLNISSEAQVSQGGGEAGSTGGLLADDPEQAVRSLYADRLDDLDHRVGIETIKLPFSVPADLEHATNGIGCPWPACCDDAELGPYLGANLIELRDLIRSDVGVVHDHGRRLQTAQVVRDLRAVLIDQEERISLQRERPHEKRLPGPRLADKQAITFVLFQPAHLPFAAKHCISQQRSLGDGKQAQRCGPPRNPQEPPAPFGLSIETLRKPVLIVGLPERHAAGASCFEEPAPTDAE